MQVLRLGAEAPPGWRAPAVTIGNFDGVHRGHQALVARTADWARSQQGTVVALTFDPHPARVLAPTRAPLALSTHEQKVELLAALGVDVLAVLPFTARVAGLGAADFVRTTLAEGLGARHVVVGADFRFGHGRSGDVATLAALGRSHGFSVEAIAPVPEGGLPVSSSRVRDALARGDVAAVRALTGRAYFVDGRVVHGDERGRTIGVPTANLEPENEIVPARGVYAGRCRLASGRTAAAVVNVGERPTFGGATVRIEAHLLDFAGELYGARLRLSFTHRLREERRFSGQDALVAQIGRDIAEARLLLSEPKDEGL